jgi:hypothetical protein
MADPSETTQVSHEPTAEQADLVGAVRELAVQVGSLKEDVQALRADARLLPSGELERAGWDESAPVAVREGPAWIRSVDSPRPRGLAVPWLLLEILFLVAVAVLCAVAGLDAPVIAGVMVAAFVLVAGAEWFASRADRQRRALVYAGPPVTASVPDDRTWFSTNGDDTLLDAPSSERPPARLPPPE